MSLNIPKYPRGASAAQHGGKGYDGSRSHPLFEQVVFLGDQGRGPLLRVGRIAVHEGVQCHRLGQQILWQALKDPVLVRNGRATRVLTLVACLLTVN